MRCESAWRAILVIAAAVDSVHVSPSEATETPEEEPVWLGRAREDLKCDVCGQVASHIWASLVNDWSTASERGEYVRQTGTADMVGEMLKDVCDSASYSSGHSPILGHFLKMYYVHECRGEEGSDNCKPGQHWKVAQDESWFGKDNDNVRKVKLSASNQMTAYQDICSRQLLPLESEFAASIKTQFKSEKTKLGALARATQSADYSFADAKSKVSTVIANGMDEVRTKACQQLCPGRKGKRTKKSKKQSKMSKLKGPVASTAAPDPLFDL